MTRLKLLFPLLVLAFLVRLYGFGNPIADWHSWRQADTSAVSRNFIKYGFDILHPRFDDLSNVASGIDNPNGYRFVEFPLYNVFQAGFFKIFNSFTIEQWGRLIAIFSSLLSMVFLYLLTEKYAGRSAAILAAFFFAFLPYNIYFQRTILPDSSMVMAMLGGIFFFDLAIEKKFQMNQWIYSVLSIIFTAVAFLLKPYALFFTLPMIYLAWKKFGIGFIKKWQLWFFLILSSLPLILWRFWMQQYPEGIAANAWLFNGDNIRFKGAFFYWIFADRIARLILGFWGLPILLFGILAKTKKGFPGGFFFSFIASSLLYIFVIAKGNVQHDYYQILIIPTLTIFLGLGGNFLLHAREEYFNKILGYLLFIICTVFMFSFSWYFVRDYFNINNFSIVVAGEAVDRLTPKNAKVIAPYNGDTSFLYQTKRAGWASFEKSLPEMIKIGADFLVLVNPTKEDYQIGKTYKIISASSDYILFDLHQNP